MVDFTASLNKGISAAQNAERNRAEIYTVFKEMNAQLSHATDGKIDIELVQFDEPSNILTNTLASIFQNKKYWAVAVRQKVHKTYGARELARWKQDPAGYPCWITIGDTQLACENKEALETALAELISTPAAGEIIYQAIKFEPKQAPG